MYECVLIQRSQMTCITITCISLLHNYTESRKCDVEKSHGDGTLYHRLYITVVIHMK